MLAHYLQRIRELGFNGLREVLIKRQRKKAFSARWKQRSLAQAAGLTWADIVQEFRAPKKFDDFFELLKKNHHLEKVLIHRRFVEHLPPHFSIPQELFAHADHIAQGCLDILGFGEHCFGKNIKWHEDFFSGQTESFSSFKNQFYQDIKIPFVNTAENTDQEKRNPDIKIPWEISRFNHIFVLGMAYRAAQEISHYEWANRYARAFHAHVSQWMHQNPYLLGVNWLCPMDVGIRAINLLWGFHFFKNEPSIMPQFFEKLVCSLYNHLEYLEYNFETSDKPNNHYLADLLGYFYLSTFFINIKKIYRKRQHALKLLVEQLHHQILPDGTCYEGSTAYHILVTEIFLHTFLLGQAHALELPFMLEHRLNQMLTFAAQVTYSNGTLIQIGDNDSGKIVAGLYIKPRLHDTLSSYKDFGLTIIRNNGIHLTFRHATFAPYQPSGHFHYDQLSITLSVDGIPILVDPGSYCYTSQPTWRNTFRDFSYHNNMYLESPALEPRIAQELDLFQLKRISESSQSLILDQEKTIELVDRYQAVQEPDIVAHRSLDLDKNARIITLYDWWTAEHNPKYAITCWSFMFAPSIQLVQDEQTKNWIVELNAKPLASITSTLRLESTQGWFSPAYGVKLPCTRLVAQLPLSQTKQKTTVQLF
ncbi:alginate lyase family protein [Candidatus Dependentiae bacterium]|jgi:hypothetical protein|nr:alginate lyase family protein [Candidatus Dependentiae bacterium]